MKKRLDRRCLVGLGALVVALVCFAAGTAVAATLSVTGNGQWSGSDSGNTFTESGTLSGPPYFLPGSSFSGTQTTGSTIGTIPECTTGSTSMSGSLTLTAANGDVLNTSVLGTVCKFIPNPAFPGWVFTGNYTITGGTGQFTGASGSGLADLSFPDFPAPPGFQFLLSLFGSINFPQHSTATEVSCTPQPVVAGNSTTCTATVTDTAANGQTTPTGTVSFTSSGPGTFGSGGSCMLTAASSSSASCSVTYTPGSTPANPVRTDTITASYSGDATHAKSSNTTDVEVISPTAIASGSFVIGDQNATMGKLVTFSDVEFWGSDWWKVNSLSGGRAPAAFKGFAASSSSPPTCGEHWTTDTGNSSGPPPTVPGFMEVIAASKITQSGTTISGDAPEVVVVKTNPGYAPNPGHKGTGTLVAEVCHL